MDWPFPVTQRLRISLAPRGVFQKAGNIRKRAKDTRYRNRYDLLRLYDGVHRFSASTSGQVTRRHSVSFSRQLDFQNSLALCKLDSLSRRTVCLCCCVELTFLLLTLEFFPKRQSVEDELVESGRIQTITICLLSLVLVISPLIIFLVRNATQTIQVGW